MKGVCQNLASVDNSDWHLEQLKSPADGSSLPMADIPNLILTPHIAWSVALPGNAS